MYQIVANSTGNVLWISSIFGSHPTNFYTEEEAWAYLEERYIQSGLSLWNVEKIS